MGPSEVDYNWMGNIYEHVKNISKMMSSIMSSINELTKDKEVEDKEEQKKSWRRFLRSGEWANQEVLLKKSNSSISIL